MAECFGSLDSDKGMIRTSTLRLMLTAMGERMTDAQMEEVIRGVHAGDSGEINVNDLMRHITSLDDV